LFGASVTGFALAVMQINGTVFQIAYTFFGVAGGPLLGVFVLAMFLPWSNTKVWSTQILNYKRTEKSNEKQRNFFLQAFAFNCSLMGA